MTTPALLGGRPAFDPPLPFARPTIEDPARVLSWVGESLDTGMVTDGPRVQELEGRVAEAFGVQHCVAVSSCTAGLMLVVQALAPQGKVVVPSFTFSATGHAAAWNGHTPTFADCSPDYWTLGAEAIPGDASLVIGVHVSGVPCDVDALEQRCREIGADLIFDAAHGSGSLVVSEGQAVPLGRFGRAEVFSLTPTKVLSGAEGGLITTNDADLAQHLRWARNYGNPGDYDTRFAGINARLSELHAAMALQSLQHLEERVAHRNAVADTYRTLLGQVPGVGFQKVPAGARSCWKDFTILIDESEFGLSAPQLVEALAAEGIATRRYYSPALHDQTAYAHIETTSLPVTERLATQVVSLPIWSHLPVADVEKIAGAVAEIHESAESVRASIAARA